MALTEMTAKPEQPDSSQVDGKRETTQNPSTDPIYYRTSSADSTEKFLQGASSWDDLPVKLFQPEPFGYERKE
ncbi:hypothetical protein DL98DRAFT_597518 [Cadophora sp. DSE1049]|nr:hypothetical protein DL98DRAFT_597518 [Cadophora sp. DSE1049]